ncbi:MAG: bile acid:sodium symporter family protein [Rubripirellula sp.]|nr:bile acid:sodium symporter family protein [Rubripirellula sp.]
MKWTHSILFWLLLTSSLALFWPQTQIGFDPFVMKTWMLWLAIMFTMFSLGGLVSPEELKPLRTRPWWVVLGVGVQVVVMPLAAWTITCLIPMDSEMKLGVLLVGCVPGAMASNVLTNTARGSVAYSVSLTSVATLLSPLTVPSILWLLARQQTENSLAKSAFLLALLVTLPTILGYLASAKVPRIRSFLRRNGSKIASFSLLWIISTVVAANREALKSVSVLILLALLFVNLAGYLGGYLVGAFVRLPESYRRALTLEIGMQNAGLGTTLSVTILGEGTTAAIPTAAYTFGCMLTGTLLAVIWRNLDEWGRPKPDSDE